MINIVTEKAHAKINLALDVLAKRIDNYHEVKMIMQTVDFGDIVRLTPLDSGIIVSTTRPELACDQTNLAYQAAALLRDTYNLSLGVSIHIEKNIPMAAGLAGGSSDAAAVLRGLNKLWSLQLTLQELECLGAKLGSDVPFCVKGGTVLATGRGEILTALPDYGPCYIVLAKPNVAVSTAWVYKNYRPEKVILHPNINQIIAVLKKGDIEGIGNFTSNVLESVTIPAHPVILELKTHMLKQGSFLSLMSGSGPTVFGLMRNKKIAEEVAASLKHQTCLEVFVTKTLAKVGE